MGEQRLHSALAPIDILTREDLEQANRKQLDNFWMEKYRGESYQEYNNAPQGGVTSFQVPGPDSGLTWSVKMVSAVLSAAGSLAIFLGDNILTAPVGGGPTVVMGGLNVVTVTFSSNAVVLQDQRVITLLSATGNIMAVKVIAKQVPSEMVGKL